MGNIYQTRRSNAQILLRKVRQEALLFTDLRNIFYLSGFSSSDGALLITESEAILFVDGRYITQARKADLEMSIREYQNKVEALSAAIVEKKVTKVGIEGEAISFDLFNKLKNTLPARVTLTSVRELAKIRIIKSVEEVANIRVAAMFVASVVPDILQNITKGVIEKEIAATIEYRLKIAGASGVPFDPIVASGPNSAFPHAKPSERELTEGDVLLVDCGAISEGYASDETVVFFIGRMGKEQENVFNAVQDAHDEAIEMIRAGIPARDVDATVRRRLAFHGLDRYFKHSTGHGVGLAIHEEPRLSPASNDILEEGMVVTIEPGVYIPGKFGIRIEDTVLVKENCCEILTKISKARAIIYM